MKKILLFLILMLTLTCFAGCDTLFNDISQAIGGGGSNSTGGDNEGDSNNGNIQSTTGSASVTITEYDGNGKLVTREENVNFASFAEFGGYEKWLEYSVTLWDIYRFETCFDINVNGKPIPDGYTIADGDKIVLTEKEPAYVITLHQTTYDGGESSYSYRLCEPITLERFIELLVDDSGVYGHHIDYFKSAYSVTAGGVAFSLNAELSRDMQIDVYKSAPSFTLYVLSADSRYEEFDMHGDTNLYTALIDYFKVDVAAQMDAGYKVFFGDKTISDVNDLKNYTVTPTSNAVLIKHPDGANLKLSVNGDKSFDAKGYVPGSLDKLLIQFLGMTYEEAQNIFVFDTDGKIVGGFICDATYLNLESKEDLDACEVILNIYAHTGDLISTESCTVDFGTRLSEVTFSQFNPADIDNNTDVYLDGKLMTKDDLDLIIRGNITLEKRITLSEESRPLTRINMDLGDIDIQHQKYEFIVKLFDESNEEYSSDFKTKDYNTPVKIDDVVEAATGYTVYELMELDIYAEVRSQTENRSISPDETVTGECEVLFHGGKSINLTVWREINGTRTILCHALGHTRMYAKDFISSISYFTGGLLSPSSFTNKRVGTDTYFFHPEAYLYYGCQLDAFAVNFEGDYKTEEDVEGIIVIGDYEPFDVKLYYNGTYLKTVTYTYAMNVEDIYPEVPGYTANSWCHINGHSNAGDNYIRYIYSDCEIGIFDTYTPGLETEKDKYE